MKTLLDTRSLTSESIERIWSLVPAVNILTNFGPVAFSFQGSGTRTRTTFIQAISHLGLQHTELPMFLDTKERSQDMAGYLDPFYSFYIIRYQDHDRMSSFADAWGMDRMEHSTPLQEPRRYWPKAIAI